MMFPYVQTLPNPARSRNGGNRKLAASYVHCINIIPVLALRDPGPVVLGLEGRNPQIICHTGAVEFVLIFLSRFSPVKAEPTTEYAH